MGVSFKMLQKQGQNYFVLTFFVIFLNVQHQECFIIPLSIPSSPLFEIFVDQAAKLVYNTQHLPSPRVGPILNLLPEKTTENPSESYGIDPGLLDLDTTAKKPTIAPVTTTTPDWKFNCTDGNWIHVNWVCDGNPDC